MTRSNTPALDYYIDLLCKAEKVFSEAVTVELQEEASAFAVEIADHLLELKARTAYLEACYDLEAK